MQEIIDVINSDKKVLVITGAGISTLSGIPDFRGKDGLYTKDESIKDKLSIQYFYNNQSDFFEFYKNTMMLKGYEPNIIHEVLAELEKRGKIMGIVTQNVDGLHQKAGSKTVLEYHGNCSNYYCTRCFKSYTQEEYELDGNICPCMGYIRPNMVLYGEAPNYNMQVQFNRMMFMADAVIVLGSSLTVRTIGSTLSSFMLLEKNRPELYIANNQHTPFDKCCTAPRYEGDLKDLFEALKKQLDDEKNQTEIENSEIKDITKLTLK